MPAVAERDALERQMKTTEKDGNMADFQFNTETDDEMAVRELIDGDLRSARVYFYMEKAAGRGQIIVNNGEVDVKYNPEADVSTVEYTIKEAELNGSREYFGTFEVQYPDGRYEEYPEGRYYLIEVDK